ncbi:uncharacterized protein LOC117644629 [Thrips palmi]|uniref:Uncharacterized protein LOC117644629 n=1 Tax=Thrips palmi TaxID=161013 RepID=A0A6P8YSR5_THRPL|nr:uncharacterized protein LOC117644629 [Thrips palmi]
MGTGDSKNALLEGKRKASSPQTLVAKRLKLSGSSASSVQTTQTSSGLRPHWKCFTCSNKDLTRTTITDRSSPNFGRVYFACFNKNCSKEKPFLFWAPISNTSKEITQVQGSVQSSQQGSKGTVC